MTLPSSGSISTTQVAAEIGVSAPIDITGAACRALTGVASGPVSLPGNFYGKSSFRADFTIGSQTDVAVSGSIRRASRALTGSVTGGSGSYAYAYSILTGDVHNAPFPTNTANIAIRQDYDTAGAGKIPETSNVQLIVTDAVTGLSTSPVTHNVSIS